MPNGNSFACCLNSLSPHFREAGWNIVKADLSHRQAVKNLVCLFISSLTELTANSDHWWKFNYHPCCFHLKLLFLGGLSLFKGLSVCGLVTEAAELDWFRNRFNQTGAEIVVKPAWHTSSPLSVTHMLKNLSLCLPELNITGITSIVFAEKSH